MDTEERLTRIEKLLECVPEIRNALAREREAKAAERGYAIARMDVGDGLDALEAIPYREFARTVQGVGDRVVELALAAHDAGDEDMHGKLMSAMSTYQRDLVRVTINPGKHFWVLEAANVRAFHNQLGARSISIDVAMANAMEAAGLTVTVIKDKYGYPISAKYRRADFTRGVHHLTADGYGLAYQVDPEMRAAIASGTVIARECSADEDRGLWLAALQTDRERQADHAHLNSMATNYSKLGPAIPQATMLGPVN
jgi:hypothetical protein